MKRLYNIIAGLLCWVSVSCHTDFLEVKPDSRLAVPSSLKDMDALMDNMTVMNTTSVLIMGEIGTDDYYLNETEWNSLTNPYQKMAMCGLSIFMKASSVRGGIMLIRRFCTAI